LQGGNLSGAQQAFATFQQAVQQQGQSAQGAGGHHHHFHRGGGSQTNSELSQAFSTLEQAVQSGNTTSAQSAIATLQQDLQQFGFNLGTSATGTGNGTQSTGTTAGGLNLTA
jgi:hypothetical protein